MPAADTVPDNPDNAALELIMGIHVLREYTSALRAEHAFAGCHWPTPATSPPRSATT